MSSANKPGSFTELLAQSAIGIARVILAVAIGCIFGALLFAGVEYLRTFHASSSMAGVARTTVEAHEIDGFVLGVIEQFIEWYSSTFFGYSRFGSGLGILMGAFFALGPAKEYRVPARLVIGFLAGFCIGVRSAMFILSKPELVLGFGILGGLITAIYLWLAGRPSRFEPLPRLQLKHRCPDLQ